VTARSHVISQPGHVTYQPGSRDRSADEVQAAALRLGRDDMTLVRRRLGRKSHVADLPPTDIDL